ncbi:MAG: AMP-binding protein [Pseudomonadota bacterium]
MIISIWFKQVSILQAYLKDLYLLNDSLYPEQIFILAIETDNRFLISLFLLSSWELPICIFPISTAYADKNKNYLLQQCGVRLLLSDRKNINGFTYSTLSIKQLLIELDINIVDLDPIINFKKLNQQLQLNSEHNNLLDTIKLIVTTSGSTAQPKAVYLSKNNIISHCLASRTVIKLNKQSLWLNCLPLNHVSGLMILYRCLLAQSNMLLYKKFNIEYIVSDFKQYQPSHISLVPIMLQKLLDNFKQQEQHDLKFLANLQYVLLGGSSLDISLVQQSKDYNLPLYLGYGSTESCSHISLKCLDSTNLELSSVKQLSSGLPLAGVELKIIPLNKNKSTGLICFRGNMVMSGYANPDYALAIGKKDNWFCSQDIVYLDSQGELIVLERKDNIINTGGLKIHPQQVELLMDKCEGIDNLRVFAIEHKSWGQIIAMDYSGKWQTEQLLEWIQLNIKSPYKPRIVTKL